METETLWLGTQTAYDTYLSALKAIAAKADMQADMQADTPREPWLLDVQGGVAVLNISGSLVEGSAGWGRYYGEVGYNDIREALAAAVQNPTVSSIVLNIASGGGQVAGVHETAQLIQRVNKVKPVVTYSGSTMASAALWLGVSGKKVFASQTAEVGSIGILMMHADKSKMLSDNGVKVTVIRAGTEKALATPYEPLSDKAKQGLQDRANALYDIFIGHVADARGTTVAAADTAYGQGRVFLGQQAKDVGLLDQVGTFEDAMAYAEKLGAKIAKPMKPQHAPTMNSFGRAALEGGLAVNAANNDASTLLLSGKAYANLYSSPVVSSGLTSSTSSISLEGIANMPKPLTDEQLAAMAAGVDLTAELAAQPDAAAQPDVAQPAQPAAASKPDVQSAMDMAKEMLAQAQTDLVMSKSEVITLKAQLSARGTELETVKAETDKFVEIARASVKTMGLHFGLTSESVAAMRPSDVLAEHARLSDLFKAKFKVGGVAATTSDSVKPKQAVPLVFAAMSNQAK